MRFSKTSVEHWFDCDYHEESRTLYMGGTVNDEGDEHHTDAKMAEAMIKGLHLLKWKNGDKPATIIMNNIGGEWNHGLGIYDAIVTRNFHLTIEVYGSAMSMGSIILQAADVRVLAPETQIMIHDGHVTVPREIHPTELDTLNREVQKNLTRMYQIYANRAGRTLDFWREKCTWDHYLNAQEAVELGLADKIMPTYGPGSMKKFPF